MSNLRLGLGSFILWTVGGESLIRTSPREHGVHVQYEHIASRSRLPMPNAMPHRPYKSAPNNSRQSAPLTTDVAGISFSTDDAYSYVTWIKVSRRLEGAELEVSDTSLVSGDRGICVHVAVSATAFTCAVGLVKLAEKTSVHHV